MRPRELTLEGFRSYRDRTTFDFRDRRLVGIVGPIGAGKSSILDAIAFALYGKTPAVESATRSLIHQLCDAAHVELVFQVDGQTWRVQRGLRRKGQSGHKLERLAEDAPDAEVLESIQQEKPTRERVEELLGLSFDAFCRSVLLAQNRFSQFLKATPTERNDVLRGVFGYERFDAALQIAKRRAAEAEGELAGLASERDQVLRAREELGEAREAAARAAERDQELSAARPSLETLAETIERSSAAAEEAAERIGHLQAIAADLPRAEALEDLAAAAADAGEAAAAAEAEVAAAEDARATAVAERDAVAQRLGDADDLRGFAVLVERFDAEVAAVRTATESVARIEAAHAAAVVAAEEAGVTLAATVAAAARAGADADAAELALAHADAALHDARHADMAHELRRSLTAGDPCPVCGQHVVTMPPLGRAVGVSKAERALGKAREAAAAARPAAEAARTDAVAAAERARTADDAVARTRAEHGASVEGLRRAEAALAVTRSAIVDGLGDGDPRTALAERERELQAAGDAVREATETLEAVRTARDALQRRQAAAADAIAGLAAALTGAWGRLGEQRTVDRSPDAVRGAYVEIGESVIARVAEADATRSTMVADAAAARVALREGLDLLGLPVDTDLTAALAQARATRAAAEERVRGIEARIEAASDLEARVAAAEERRDLARRLASDLQPSRFLAFLLEEERAALAELGGHHFEELTDGGYRFSDDDTFSIVDMNAASQVRKADSLSGGETFLASLALALALAEMVARGGGRLDAFFLDEGFGSLDPEHLDRAMDGIGRLVAEDGKRLVVLVSHVEEMKQTMEDLIVLDKDVRTGDTVVVSGARPSV